VLGLTGWFGLSRLVRGEVRALREREWVIAARSLGASGWRILFRHLLPNVASPIIIAAALGVGDVILLEAGLSFLGLGVQPPHASWGTIMQDGADQVRALWWLSVFPDWRSSPPSWQSTPSPTACAKRPIPVDGRR